MIIDRSQRTWFLFVMGSSVLAGGLYWVTAHPESFPLSLNLPGWLEKGPGHPTFGHQPLGLAYGIISLLIFVFAALLGARRKKPTWQIGRAYLWLQGHIWLTLLTIPLVLFHMDFRMGGVMTSSLMWLYIFVMGSGIFGVVMQNVLPNLMREKLPEEFIFEQIPHITAQLIANVEKLKSTLTAASKPVPAAPIVKEDGTTEPAPVAEVDGSPAVLLEFIEDKVLPFLTSPKPCRHPLYEQSTGDTLIRLLKVQITETYQAQSEALQDIVEQRRQMALQTRLQHWLHGWLLFHVPLSLLLLVFTVWHAFVAVWSY